MCLTGYRAWLRGPAGRTTAEPPLCVGNGTDSASRMVAHIAEGRRQPARKVCSLRSTVTKCTANGGARAPPLLSATPVQHQDHTTSRSSSSERAESTAEDAGEAQHHQHGCHNMRMQPSRIEEGAAAANNKMAKGSQDSQDSDLLRTRMQSPPRRKNATAEDSHALPIGKRQKRLDSLSPPSWQVQTLLHWAACQYFSLASAYDTAWWCTKWLVPSVEIAAGKLAHSCQVGCRTQTKNLMDCRLRSYPVSLQLPMTATI